MNPLRVTSIRFASSNIRAPKDTQLDPKKTFYHRLTEIQKSTNLKQKPENASQLAFGKLYTDHMVDIDWSKENGWQKPLLKPLKNLELHPGAKVLHYALELFEGLKAYYGVDGKVRLFRPELNMRRMKASAERSCFPDFDEQEAVKMIEEFVRLESAWVPRSETASLYLRPTLIATEPSLGVSEANEAKWFLIGSPVGSYFQQGAKGLSLLADPSFVRSWPGGVGAFKMGSNYAPTVYVGKKAAERNCQQVMWLSGEDDTVTEAGAMNLFLFWRNEQGEDELITAPLDSGLLLPGITRQSILELTREWNEFKVSERDYTMHQIVRALDENRVYEFFSAGTAAVVGPISEIIYVDRKNKLDRTLQVPTQQSKFGLMQRLYDTMTGIQYGRIDKTGWTRVIE